MATAIVQKNRRLSRAVHTSIESFNGVRKMSSLHPAGIRVRGLDMRCRCGGWLVRIDGHLKCKSCGFSNEPKLHCQKCLSKRVVRFNKNTNRCIECGKTWTYRRVKHHHVVIKVITRYRQFKKSLYLRVASWMQLQHDRFCQKYFVVRNQLGEFY